jgi:hypothetical protein
MRVIVQQIDTTTEDSVFYLSRIFFFNYFCNFVSLQNLSQYGFKIQGVFIYTVLHHDFDCWCVCVCVY